MGTIDFWNFLCAHVKYNHFKYTDQIWCYYHHYSPFYGWFYRIEIYSKYTGFARFWGGALSLNTNIFRTENELFILISSNDDRYTTITIFLVESLLYLYYLNELWKCRYSECEIWLSIWMFEFSIFGRNWIFT